MARTGAAKKTAPADKIPTRKEVQRKLQVVEDKEKREKEGRKTADLKSVQEFAEGLSTKFLQCRELGHNWKPYHVQRLKGGAYLRTLRCPRCTTKREQELSSRGAVVSNRYIHPDDYLRKGMGAITGTGRDILRLTSILRVEVHEEKD